jgi:hypothetical protein
MPAIFGKNYLTSLEAFAAKRTRACNYLLVLVITIIDHTTTS